MILAYSFAGSTMTVLVSSEETGGSFSVLHVIKPTHWAPEALAVAILFRVNAEILSIGLF